MGTETIEMSSQNDLTFAWDYYARQVRMHGVTGDETKFMVVQELVGALDPRRPGAATGWTDEEWDRTLRWIGDQAIRRTLALLPLGAADYEGLAKEFQEPLGAQIVAMRARMHAFEAEAQHEAFADACELYYGTRRCTGPELRALTDIEGSRRYEQAMGPRAIELGVGNCGEHSAVCRDVVKQLAKEQGVEIRTWRYGVHSMDHNILLIDRPDGDFTRGYMVDPWNASIPFNLPVGFATSLAPIASEEANGQLDGADRARIYGQLRNYKAVRGDTRIVFSATSTNISWEGECSETLAALIRSSRSLGEILRGLADQGFSVNEVL